MQMASFTIPSPNKMEESLGSISSLTKVPTLSVFVAEIAAENRNISVIDSSIIPSSKK